MPVLFGEKNAHLQKIEDMLDIEISSRGNEVLISGDPVGIERARQILEALWSKIQQGQTIDINTVNSAIRFQSESQNQKKGKNGNGDHGAAPPDSDTTIITRKKKIDARNPVQARYIQAMQKQNCVFGIGPAGTGKTYLAVAMAVAMLEAGRIERIILSRPAVEAGERIGFLPGEMKEKMDPYLRPLYDALHDTMSGEKVQKKIASEEIEIAPLAFMRGRTLNNSFIILDEAQNTTPMQMLMFLTRMGENSRMVITGDPSQTDLPNHQKSGLAEAIDILTGVEGIEFASFTSADVVRHPLVTKIVQAYEKKRT